MPRRSVAKRRGGGPDSVNERATARYQCLCLVSERQSGDSVRLFRSRNRQGVQKQPTRPRRSLADIAILPSFSERPAHFNIVVQASRLLSAWLMAREKRVVYVMKNTDDSPRFYVGLTSDVNARLEDHNAGRCPHTAAHRPWHLHVVLEFPDQPTAIRFERYLKSGSGRAFAKRHFEP